MRTFLILFMLLAASPVWALKFNMSVCNYDIPTLIKQQEDMLQSFQERSPKEEQERHIPKIRARLAQLKTMTEDDRKKECTDLNKAISEAETEMGMRRVENPSNPPQDKNGLIYPAYYNRTSCDRLDLERAQLQQGIITNLYNLSQTFGEEMKTCEEKTPDGPDSTCAFENMKFVDADGFGINYHLDNIQKYRKLIPQIEEELTARCKK